MKTLIALALLTFSLEVVAAESIVHPFKFSFTMATDEYDIDGIVRQNCRYEKLVISDSAEYYDDYKRYPLTINKVIKNGEAIFTVSNDKERFHEVTGWFKPTKECDAYIELNIKSALYSAWLRQRPISFQFRTNAYFQERVELDAREIRNRIENATLEFFYKPVANVQVNINLLINGKNDFWPSQNAAINPETKMPYPLVK